MPVSVIGRRHLRAYRKPVEQTVIMLSFTQLATAAHIEQSDYMPRHPEEDQSGRNRFPRFSARAFLKMFLSGRQMSSIRSEKFE